MAFMILLEKFYYILVFVDKRFYCKESIKW